MRRYGPLLAALLALFVAAGARAQTAISALPAASSPAAADLLPAVHSGTTSKETVGNVITTSTAGETWDRTFGIATWNFGNVATTSLQSANHITPGYTVEAGVGYLTGLSATNQSLTSFIGRNTTAGGYTTITLANDAYSLGSLLTVPNSDHCCDVNNDHQLQFYLGGTSAPSGFINGLPSGEQAAIATTGINMGLCLGVYAHCILDIAQTFGTVRIADTSGATVPALEVDGSSTTSNAGGYVMHITGPSATGCGSCSGGLQIESGADANDLILDLKSTASGAHYFSVRWDGRIVSRPQDAFIIAGVGATDMRAGSGSVTATATGFTTDPVNVSVNMTFGGPISCVRIAPFTATSNAASIVITLPTALPGNGAGVTLVEDGGTASFGTWTTDGTHIYFAVGPVPADATGNFTTSGTKGIPGSVGAALCWPTA